MGERGQSRVNRGSEWLFRSCDEDSKEERRVMGVGPKDRQLERVA